MCLFVSFQALFLFLSLSNSPAMYEITCMCSCTFCFNYCSFLTFIFLHMFTFLKVCMLCGSFSHLHVCHSLRSFPVHAILKSIPAILIGICNMFSCLFLIATVLLLWLCSALLVLHGLHFCEKLGHQSPCRVLTIMVRQVYILLVIGRITADNAFHWLFASFSPQIQALRATVALNGLWKTMGF